MKVKLLAAVCTSLVSLNTPVLAEEIWVDIAYSPVSTIWIDHQSIAKDKTFVSFNTKLEKPGKTTITSVAAECNTLQFQYQSQTVNNVPQAFSSSIQQTEPDTLLAAAIYYACATYVRQTF